jgi:hypothetical protein
MRELTFFLGIQVKQTKQDNFVHQVKYTNDLIKKFNMTELKSVSTPMSSAVSLGPDKDGEAVDQREYMSMISSLLYLMRLCTRFQTSPHSSHRMTVQRIFRYLKHSWVWHLVLWFFFAESCCLFRCWFCGFCDWPKEYFCDLSFSWIFSCLLVFSETVFNCTVYHRGRVYSYC